MKLMLKTIEGSIVAPIGFLASGVFCDIKKLGTGKGSNKGRKRDLALIVSEVPAAVAGMFTTNQVCAAPVKICLKRVKSGCAQALVVNSGNANACTGRQGLADAREMTAVVAAAYDRRNLKTRIPSAITDRRYKISEELVLVGSTGRIGVPMPMTQVRAGISKAVTLLDDSPASASHAAEAIMTSDTRPKQIAVEFKLGGKNVRIGGICKGAGMIQPGMSSTGKRPAALPLQRSIASTLHATMLCFITTDAAIGAKVMQAALQEAVANSFNRITVDGDMSTNDTVLVLANGLAGNEKLKIKNSKLKTFQSALNFVCLELAKKIVRDGEGVHRVVTVRVSGAKSAADADAAARAVANSPLVKTSWHGGDPNWGRIIDALGYSTAKIVEEKVDIGYSAFASASDASARRAGREKIFWSLKRGQPTPATFKQLCAAVAPSEFDLHIHLNLGKFNAVMYAADLTEDYVEFNKGDVTDASSLGG
jgi:glutamate N-acetyltransferase / amino-acid N-acetyltransferase